jgi:hypothetical protein
MASCEAKAMALGQCRCNALDNKHGQMLTDTYSRANAEGYKSTAMPPYGALGVEMFGVEELRLFPYRWQSMCNIRANHHFCAGWDMKAIDLVIRYDCACKRPRRWVKS